ncbi:class A sortase [Paucilactobacillus sp. N302-9]
MKKGRSTVKKWVWRIVFTLLVLVSIGLIFNEQIKNYLVDSYAPKVSQSTIQKNKKKAGNYDFSKVKSLDFQTVAKARMSKQKLNVIGVISIPSIKLNLPIAKGVSNVVLALAAGTMREDMKMGQGNYALAGHHMVDKKVLFSPLYEKAKIGQKIYVSDMKHVYQYKLTQRKFIKATRVDVVKDTPTKKIITLITCDATGTNRLMIRGKLAKVMSFKEAPKKVQHDLSAKYNN